MPYSVEVTVQEDSRANASFVIRPAVKFITIQGAALLGEVLTELITSRMDPDERGSFMLAITHNLPGNEATVGFARFEGLRRATGAAVLQQGLERGLNGDNQFVSPTSPIAR